MMLFKLSLSNMKKSMKDYAIYFMTLILGVAIFYVFNAIETQSAMLQVSKYTRDIIKLMTSVLSNISVFISCILGALIVYANRFLIKRRNKEFAIYLTLGMSKRKVSAILLIETLLIGLISLAVGLVFGFFLSQFMSLLVANLFEADMTKFSFVFSMEACLKTLGYFVIIYLVVMIFNTILISKCRLIHLLQAEKKQEKVKIKNPIVCFLVLTIAVVTLGCAYHQVKGGIQSIQLITDLTTPILLGVIGTFLVFWSLSGLLLKLFSKMEKIYYRGLNSFTFRQISSKINTTVIAMTIICLMLFVTICVLSSALSIKNSLTNNLKTLIPADVQITMLAPKGNDSVKKRMQDRDFEIDKYLEDIVEINQYNEETLLLSDMMGNYYEKFKKEFPHLSGDAQEEFICLSDYNKLAKLYGRKELSLGEKEYLVVANQQEWIKWRNYALEDGTPLRLQGKTYMPARKSCIDGAIDLSSVKENTGVFVLPDSAFEGLSPSENMLFANYKADSKKGKQKIEAEMRTFLENAREVRDNGDVYYHVYGNTKIDLYESSIGIGAIVTFLGLYLGIIFLISSAAVLALKELSESSDNRERFQMLRRLGADEKMINQALFKQIGVFFLFPLLLAMIHSIFGIRFVNQLLEIFGNEKLLSSIVMTAVFLIGIYGGYFILTYVCSKKIISQKY